MKKSDLRQKMKSIICSLPDVEARCASVLEDEPFHHLLVESSKILLFHPLKGEPQIDETIVGRFPDKEFFFPTPEPSELLSLEIDLALIPGLAFTSQGLRLGRGGGYFDRFLVGFTGKSVGVCFQEQVLEDIPMEPHDQTVHTLLIL